MIRIEYDPSLVEKAVFHAARHDARREQALHRATDPLYEIADHEQRDRAFQAVAGELLASFTLDRVITDLLAERPIIARRVDRCVVREAIRATDQSVELFVRSEGGGDGAAIRTLVIQICPQSLADSVAAGSFLRRELLHVVDMLDQRFGYVPSAFQGSGAAGNVVRDRYRVLWEIYVVGRLIDEGKIDRDGMVQLRRAFAGAFALRSPQPVRQIFDKLIEIRNLTHQQLFEWATHPAILLDQFDDCDCATTTERVAN